MFDSIVKVFINIYYPQINHISKVNVWFGQQNTTENKKENMIK
jgi:hypothetical protein